MNVEQDSICSMPYLAKKGDLFSIRDNKIRDVTANLLKEVCKDITVEPQLLPLTGEAFEARTANISDEARCDVSARGFWSAGQLAFLDIRVFNPTAKRYSNQSLTRCYEANEKEKKKSYNERILQVDHGTFTPIVLSATGGMGREAAKLYRRLAEMIAEKRRQPYAIIITWIKRKISFALSQNIGMCIRGSRSVRCCDNIVPSTEDDACISEIRSCVEDRI